MMDNATLAGQLRHISIFFQALTDAADKLDQLNSLDNAVVEAQRERDTAIAAQSSAVAAAKMEWDKIPGIQAHGEEILSEAQAKADEILHDAQTAADAVAAQATGRAQEVISQAVTDAATQQAILTKQNQFLEDGVKDLQSQVDAEGAALVDLQSQVSAAEAKLASAQEAIQRLLS